MTVFREAITDRSHKDEARFEQVWHASLAGSCTARIDTAVAAFRGNPGRLIPL